MFNCFIRSVVCFELSVFTSLETLKMTAAPSPRKIMKSCSFFTKKANHSFMPNAEWMLFEHPRFGLIRGLKAAQDLPADQEILVNYTINLADAPEWYR